MSTKRLDAQRGIVCRLKGDPHGYFGWPSIARLGDGTLIAAASGLRTQHVCPWGRTVICVSRDDGRTWTPPRVVNDTPLDDRDAGIVSLGGNKLLLAWFTSDTRRYAESCRKWFGAAAVRAWRPVLEAWDDRLVKKWLGSWVRVSPDGGDSWGDFFRAPVTAPHGPIRLRDGTLLYLGKAWGSSLAPIQAARSDDDGRTWTRLGRVPETGKPKSISFYEPHAVELRSGRIIGHIRAEGKGVFTVYQTESADRGRTWTPARPLGVCGSPPHLLRHSGGALVCVFGRRTPPFGQRAIVSRDQGRTWPAEHVLRADGPDGDLGYPATVELADGSLFTVYYQKAAPGEKCSLLWSRWGLPE